MKEKQYPDCFLMSDNGVAVTGIDIASPKVMPQTIRSEHLSVFWIYDELLSCVFVFCGKLLRKE